MEPLVVSKRLLTVRSRISAKRYLADFSILFAFMRKRKARHFLRNSVHIPTTFCAYLSKPFRAVYLYED